tara:strand:+ start:213 stop:362 length:150 start_codon:yes stop_codon:yes gene_type:complete
MSKKSIKFYEKGYAAILDGTKPFYVTPPDALVRAGALEKVSPRQREAGR